MSQGGRVTGTKRFRQAEKTQRQRECSTADNNLTLSCPYQKIDIKKEQLFISAVGQPKANQNIQHFKTLCVT